MSDRRPVVVLDRTRLILGSCREVLLAGAIVVVEDSGYRVRRLPLKWRVGRRSVSKDTLGSREKTWGLFQTAVKTRQMDELPIFVCE